MSTTSTPFPILPKIALARFGARISQARRVRGMTQTDLAQFTGLGLSTIVKLESGSPGVAIGAMVRVLDALGQLGQLDDLLDPRKDPQFAEAALRQLPERVRG